MATTTTNSQSSAPAPVAEPTVPEGAQSQTQHQDQAQQFSTADEHHQAQFEPQPLSKNAQKKLRKAEFIAERKLERRAREKEKKKEKKRERAERIAAGEDVDTAAEDDGRAKKRAKLSHGAPRNAFGARVVVDLGFDDKMSEKVRCLSFTPPCPPSHFPYPISIRGASWSRRVSSYLHACIRLLWIWLWS